MLLRLRSRRAPRRRRSLDSGLSPSIILAAAGLHWQFHNANSHHWKRRPRARTGVEAGEGRSRGFCGAGKSRHREGGRVVPGSDYLAIASAVEPELTVVGPEAPLVAGVVDQFRAAGSRLSDPLRANAQLEGSKIHSKELMQRLGIPTARFRARGDAEEGSPRSRSSITRWS